MEQPKPEKQAWLVTPETMGEVLRASRLAREKDPERGRAQMKRSKERYLKLKSQGLTFRDELEGKIAKP